MKYHCEAGRMIALLVVSILAVASRELGSETYKLLTYYPAPYGSYKKFVTTADTWLARDSGRVLIGLKSSSDSGAVLETSGSIKSGNLLIARNVSGSVPGMLRFDGKNLSYSVDNGAHWINLGAQEELPPGGVNYSAVTIDGPATAKTVGKTYSVNAVVTECSATASYTCSVRGSFACNSTKHSSSTQSFTDSQACASSSARGNQVSVVYKSISEYCAAHNQLGANANNCGWNYQYTGKGSLTPVKAVLQIQDKNVEIVK